MEDLDGPRAVPGMGRAILADLAWLGLDWDAGPGKGGPHSPYRQSERFALYEASLVALHGAGRLFPCFHSRKDLQRLATAPHGPDGAPAYPATLRPERLAPGWFDARDAGALRFMVPDTAVTFEDQRYGRITESVAATVGDFVLQRRDGVYAYQLAVVVDDLLMGVTEVVRGEDLLASTARQILLIEALGGQRPRYGHVPLVLTSEGVKLSKRDASLSIASLRQSGVRAEVLVGYFGHSLGLLAQARPCAPADLLKHFDWERLSPHPWRLPGDLGAELASFDTERIFHAA